MLLLSRKAQAAAATKKLEQVKPDDKVMQFHKELMETCIDMMSRFAFSTCATMPKRLDVTGHIISHIRVVEIFSRCTDLR